MSLLRRSSIRRHRVSTPVITTWNSADKNPGISLSGGDLTATSTTGGIGNQVVRATRPGIAGRFFVLVFTTLNTTDPDHGSGFALSNSSQSLSAYPGGSNSVAIFRNGYYEGPFGGGFLSGVSILQGDVLGIKLYETSAVFYQNGTIIGTFTSLPSGLLYPAVDLIYSDVAVANYGATTFAFPPIGATGWNG